MYISIKKFSLACAIAGLVVGGSAVAETTWAPPAEIAPKAQGAGAPDGAAPAATPAAPITKAEKEKSCADQIAAKGLKGKAKRQFKAECLKS